MEKPERKKNGANRYENRSSITNRRQQLLYESSLYVVYHIRKSIFRRVNFHIEIVLCLALKNMVRALSQNVNNDK